MSRSRGHVLVGMSGGVDSSAAAAWLKAEGFEVTGVTFRLWLDCDLRSLSDPRSCCSERDMQMAADVARILGIEHLEVDISDCFFTDIVEPFALEYEKGRTPNPCIACNSMVKFPRLREMAEGLGASFIATGHYALSAAETGSTSLLRGVSKEKDQSYALYRLGQRELERCIFPNGNMSKDQVRAAADGAGLPSAQKRDSQELCFISGGSYRDFLAARFPESLAPGPILDSDGEILGEHHGVAFYTIGQRSGLGLASPRPLYVVELDSERRAVIVGDREEVPGQWLRAESAIWVRGRPPQEFFEAAAMVRYNSPPAACSVKISDGGFEAHFKDRIWAITPGQHAVIYQGNEVIGGGVIAAAG